MRFSDQSDQDEEDEGKSDLGPSPNEEVVKREVVSPYEERKSKRKQEIMDRGTLPGHAFSSYSLNN